MNAWRTRRSAPVVQVSMDDLELIKIALFRLDEAAKRIDTLAQATQTAHVRRLLGVLSRALAAEERELSAGLRISWSNRRLPDSAEPDRAGVQTRPVS